MSNIRGNRHRYLVCTDDKVIQLKEKQTLEIIKGEFRQNAYGKIYWFDLDGITFLSEEGCLKYEVVEDIESNQTIIQYN